jgi:hypothetical protein
MHITHFADPFFCLSADGIISGSVDSVALMFQRYNTARIEKVKRKVEKKQKNDTLSGKKRRKPRPGVFCGEKDFQKCKNGRINTCGNGYVSVYYRNNQILQENIMNAVLNKLPSPIGMDQKEILATTSETEFTTSAVRTGYTSSNF